MGADVPVYRYVCTDRSPLVGPFCRYGVRWFVQWMPPAVPANLLTLGSSLCMWAMLALAVTTPPATALAWWCLALMAGYVIYDHADGMHSRRTGTSSPLGEFLDHYTDAFHGSIAVVVMFLVAGREASWMLGLGVWLVGLAGAATMVEEHERKVLYFGLVGPLEGMLLVIGYFASWCGTDAGRWWHAPLIGGVTGFETVVIACAAACLLAVLGCARRTGRMPAKLAAFALAGAVLWGLSWWRERNWWEAGLLLALHDSDFTGRVISSHLRGTPLPWPDWVAPVVMAVAIILPLPPIWLVGVTALYLLGRNVSLVSRFMKVFGGNWRWRNVAG